jgi:hypothetical protein
MCVMFVKTLGLALAMLLYSPLAAEDGHAPRFEFAMAVAFQLQESGAAENRRVAENRGAQEDRVAPAATSKSEGSQPFVTNQAPAYPLKSAFGEPGRNLNIFVLVGERAVNSIRSRSTTSPVVEVRDERNLPVQGAEVIFELPSAGPGGFFRGQNLMWTGRTDANGQVVAAGFTPNQEPGRFRIRVTASYAGRLGRAVIAQTNSIRPIERDGPQLGGRRRSVWLKAIAVTAAGAVAGGIIWAKRSGGEPPAVILQPGTVIFGGPR